jgi:sugar-specific transcriptional regulator TrmB
MPILSKDLVKIGLTSKEARIYLAALELGYASVMEIAKKAEVNRPTAYVILESLIKKGLISTFEKGKKRYFTAEAPDKLLELLRKEKIGLRQREEELKKLVPELKVLYDLAGEKPRVRFFEGKEGLRSIREDMLKSKIGKLDEIIPLDDVYKVLPPSPTDHRAEMARKLKNVPARVVYTSGQGRILKPKEKLKERHFVPKDKFPFSSEINIYDNKVAVASCRGKIIGVIIESKEMADTMRYLFDLAWEGSNKYNR